PVRYCRARVERMMARRPSHERFVEDEIGLLEAFLDVAERPLVGRLPERHLTVLRVREVFVGPFPDRDLWRRRPCGGTAAAAPAPTGRARATSRPARRTRRRPRA